MRAQSYSGSHFFPLRLSAELARRLASLAKRSCGKASISAGPGYRQPTNWGAYCAVFVADTSGFAPSPTITKAAQ